MLSSAELSALAARRSISTRLQTVWLPILLRSFAVSEAAVQQGSLYKQRKTTRARQTLRWSIFVYLSTLYAAYCSIKLCLIKCSRKFLKRLQILDLNPLNSKRKMRHTVLLFEGKIYFRADGLEVALDEVDFSTSKNHWPALRERISVQLKKEASSYCLAGNTLVTSVVRLRVWSRMRKGTPSTLEEVKHFKIYRQTKHNAV